MTSQILLDAQVFCPADYADLAILNGLSCETIKRQPESSFHGHFKLSQSCIINFTFL